MPPELEAKLIAPDDLRLPDLSGLVDGATAVRFRHVTSRPPTPVPAEVMDLVRACTRSRPLELAACLWTERTPIEIRGRDGQRLAEVTDDRVTGHDRYRDQLGHFREVEVEVHAGRTAGRDLLRAAIRRLVAADRSALNHVPKLIRALGQRAPGPLEAVIPRLGPDANRQRGHPSRLQPVAHPGHAPDLGMAQAARNFLIDLGQRAASVKFLIRDRAGQFTGSFDAVFTTNGIKILASSPQAPRANAICERGIGTLRRELFDRVLIVNEHHLRRVLTEYLQHYNTARPHRSLGQLAPAQAHTRPPQINPAEHRIRRKQVLGGLTHEYQIAA
jgi:Integrase core domain